MQAAHRVAKNTGILYAKMAITVFISLYSTRLVLAALGAKDFGLFSIVGGVIAMLGFLNASMAWATQRFMSFAQGAGDIHKMNKIFNMSILLHLLIAIVLFVVLEIAGYFFFNGSLNIAPARIGTAKLIYQFMIVSTLFTVLSVPYDALLNAHENMFFYAILGIFESILKLCIALYITYAVGDKLLNYGFLMASLSIVLLIINRIYCHRKYPESKIAIKSQFDKVLLKEMSSFAGWSLLGLSSSMIGFYGQGIILNIFFGTVVNAAQGIAGQISGQLGAFASTMLKALNPIIDKSEGAGNREMMLKASMMGSKVSFFLLMVFYVPIFIEMPYVFKLWLKSVPDYTIIFCRLLLVKNLIDQLFITIVAAISAVGNIRKYHIFISFSYFFPIIITYVLFSCHYPPSILYVVNIVFSFVSAGITLYFAKINCNLSILVYLKAVVFPCMFSFLFAIAVSVIPLFYFSESIIRLVLVIAISLVSFLPIVWIVALTLAERIYVGKLIRVGIEKIKNINNSRRR